MKKHLCCAKVGAGIITFLFTAIHQCACAAGGGPPEGVTLPSAALTNATAVTLSNRSAVLVPSWAIIPNKMVVPLIGVPSPLKTNAPSPIIRTNAWVVRAPTVVDRTRYTKTVE